MVVTGEYSGIVFSEFGASFEKGNGLGKEQYDSLGAMDRIC